MLQRISLHLGRTPAQPEGSSRDGYEITAPLDAEGRLVAQEWQASRDKCRVRRFRPGEPDRHGWLLHRAGGEDAILSEQVGDGRVHVGARDRVLLRPQ
jgi:hypothetical protein